jgi:PKD repeat protein
MFKNYKLLFLAISIVGISTCLNDLNISVKADEITPMIDTVLEFSESFLIDEMDSGWNAVYGSLSYNTDDYVSSGASLIGVPSTSGFERLRFQKVFTQPIDLLDCNIGFWVKTTGSIPDDLTLHVELLDSSNHMRRWVFYRKGLKLVGSNSIWSHHFLSSVAYYFGSTIDMSSITVVRFKFYSSTSDWTISIDGLRGFPNQDLFPNGAVMLTFDGPYDGVYDWAEPKLDEYGYKAIVATARRNYPEEDGLTRLYNKGWDICVYARMYDYSNPPNLLPLDEFTENTLGEKAWLDTLGFARSSANIQCNRHLLDVQTQDLLGDNFYFIKGSAWTSTNQIAFPSLAFYGSSTSFSSDLTRLEKAADNKNMYIWFNHLDKGTYSSAYTQEQFNALVDRIHELGMEVVTYSQLLERYYQYFNTASPVSVDAGPDDVGNEGDTFYFSGSFSDTRINYTYSATWDWGDGTCEQGSIDQNEDNSIVTGNHKYSDNGVYTVILKVTDNSGMSSRDTLKVTVNNVAPIVNAGPDQIVNEGDTINFFGDFTDAGSLDTHTYEWNFGDGTRLENTTLTPSHVYDEYGEYTVTLTITDCDGGVGVDNLTVTVNKIPTGNLTVNLSSEGYSVTENGVVCYFNNIDEVLAYLQTRFIEWESAP